MRSIDVRDDLQDGVEGAALPPMAPDGGGLAFEQAPELEEPPPRLCEAGPCRHYHRMAVQMDAQNPLAERRDGKLIRHARVFHTTTSHYCYPDVGIETNLGSLPVLECNRWVPITGILKMKRSVRAEFDRDLAAWHDAREKEAAEVAEAIDGQPVTIEVIARGSFVPERMDALAAEMTADGDTTLAMLVTRALAEWEALELVRSANLIEAATIMIDGGPITNHQATVGQLELQDGARIDITLKMKETV